METQTISSPVWISRIVPSNPFTLFFPWHCIVSSHTCTDQYSAGAPREILSRFPELFLRATLSVWYSALWTLATLAYQTPNTISLTQGDHRTLPRLPLSMLHSGSSLWATTWGNHRANPVSVLSRIIHLCFLMSSIWKHCFIYFNQFFSCFRLLDKFISCYSILAKIALSYFKNSK